MVYFWISPPSPLLPSAPLCSPPKLIYGAIVPYSDLTLQTLWALQLPPCSFHHAGVTAVKMRERREREEGNRRENKGKKLRLQMHTSAFWLIQGMAHPYGSLFITNIPYKLETFFYHPPPPFPQTSDVPEECLNYYGIPEEFAASLFNLFHASCWFLKQYPAYSFLKANPGLPVPAVAQNSLYLCSPNPYAFIAWL